MEDEDVNDSPPSPTMPSIHKGDAISLDIRLFEPSALSVEGLAKAQIKLRSVLYTYPSAAVETLLSRPNLFEYIFSVLDASDARTLANYLVDSFPSSTKDFHNSLSSKALHRIAEFMFLLPYDSEDVVKPAYSSQYFAKVQAGIRAFEALQTVSFDDKAVSEVKEEGEIQFVVKGKKSSQRQRRSRTTRKSVSFDATYLKVFDEEVPYSQEEADLLAKKILSELRLIFQSYLSNLRSPSLTRLISGQYIISKKANDVEVELVRESAEVPNPEVVTSAIVESQATCPAFPNVQPLRASLYFDSAKGFGDWRIYISTRAEKHLREHRKNMPTFQIIIKKIKELSQGHFSFDNQKRLSGPDKGIPIFEAKLTGDLRLIYQVDCISDYGSDVERQALRVYGIFTHAQMNHHLWEFLSKHLESKGSEYRRRVTHRKKPDVTGDNVFRPESWPPEKNEADGEHTTTAIKTDANGLQDIHQWLVLEKYVAFSQTLYKCILADQEVSHVFNVSPYEREIIEHDSSCYVLGRSGTGKTTTMLFKIFGIERAATTQLRQKLITSAPRQLFVTQSRVLAGRVEEYYKKLSDFLETAYMSMNGLAEKHRSKKDETEVVDELVDDDEEEWHEDLPKRFSELEDKHFPLFLTFDKLLKMLEADFELSFSRQSYTKEHKRAQKRFKLSTLVVGDDLADGDSEEEEDAETMTDAALSPTDMLAKDEETISSLVTYEAFRRDYWPHLPQNLTKNLDPALVFSEIMGVIKGSEQSLSAEKGFLSRKEYLELSHRTQSTFATSRVEVYDLFEAYQKRKHVQRDYDSADRTHAIIREMGRRGISQKVDFLYVDEAQDNLLIDAHLLRLLCSNSHGLFWAGDTAQTIAIGSAFRFNDLKSFLHRIEEMVETNPVKPSSFQLTMNYRSHGGIVSCADSVIQLITKFWPYSIDILRPEKGAVEGSKPVFFVGWEENTLRYEQFLFGESGNAVEFGARQCILVRNDRARDELRKQVGDIGVILTLYESKGLEFDDVLLYNFFEDSTCDTSQWRIVLNAVDSEIQHGRSVPQFHDIRHAGICTELKFLYVAMTRARKNLWIVDKSDKGSAMKIFFNSRNLVDLCTPEQTPALAVSSSVDEWDKMARSLFKHKQYHQAMHCFERAGLPEEKAITHAYFLRQQARALDKSTQKKIVKRKEAFRCAADAFVACAEAHTKESYWRNAGECFTEADDPRQAAESYVKARKYSEAVKQYKRASMYEEAVEIVQANREAVEDRIAENIFNVSRLHFLRIQKPEKTIALFDTMEEGMEFIEDYGSNDSRADILEKLGRYSEAADMQILSGNIGDAVRLFLRAKNVEASRQAAHCVLSRLWELFSFGVPIGINDEATELLKLCSKLDPSHLSPFASTQLEIFKAVNDPKESKPSIRLGVLYLRTHSLRDKASAIFCLDQLVKRFEPSDMDNTDRAGKTLSLFLSYAELLRSEVWNSKSAIEDEAMRSLLGIKQDLERDNEFTLLENSLLFKNRIYSRRFEQLTRFDQVLDRDTLIDLIRDTIPQYLSDRAREFNSLCLRSRVYRTPCLTFAANGACTSSNCDREHVEPSGVYVDWFQARLDVHLRMVACLQAVEFALEGRDRNFYHRIWLERISQLLYPATHTLGNIGVVPLASILSNDQSRRSLEAIRQWIHDRALSLKPESKSSTYFLDSFTEMLNLALWLNKSWTCNLIQRTPCLQYAKYRTIPGLSEETFHSPFHLVQAMQMSHPHSIAHGAAFLRFMLAPYNRFSISVFHLTELIELLCGAFTMVARFRISNMNRLTLPKSWILLILNRVNFSMPYTLNDPLEILDVCDRWVSVLLNADYDKEFMHLGRPSWTMRAICISRICRAVALLGYNNRNEVFRDQTLRMFRKHCTTQKYVHHLHKPYFFAKEWKHVSNGVRKSVLGSHLDEMVELIKWGEKSSAQFGGVRQVTFRGVNDISKALAEERKAPNLSVSAAPFTPKIVGEVIQRDTERQSSALAADQQVDEDFNGSGFFHEDASANEEPDSNEPQEPENMLQTDSLAITLEDGTPTVAQEFSPKEEAIVSLIKSRYKLRKERRQRLNEESIQCKRVRQHFAECLQVTKKMEWTGRHRRVIFLLVVPYILACLDYFSEQALDLKRKANKRWHSATDQTVNYDAIHERLEKIIKVHKLSLSLRRQLNPETVAATLRSERPFVLQQVLGDLYAVSNGIGGAGSAEGELAFVADITARESRINAVKKPKPSLNVEDILEF